MIVNMIRNLSLRNIFRTLSPLVFLMTPLAYADIAQDREVNGRVVIVQRTIQIQESDCVQSFRGLSCSVQSSLSQLIGPTLSLAARTFRYTESNQEVVLVEFTPSSTGYSFTVYPGSMEGPYLNYIKRSIRALPNHFEVIGLKIATDMSIK